MEHVTNQVIFDADSFFYAAYAKRKEYSTVFDIVQQAHDDIVNILAEYIENIGHVKNVKIVLSSQQNFRKELNPDYKKRRAPKPAMLLEAMEEYVRKYDAYMLPGLEADDVCVWQQKRFGYTIIAYDKDILLQAPGFVYNWKKQQLIDNRDVDIEQNILKQMIMGDSVDDIPGAPGYGEVKVNKMFQEYVYIDDAEELFEDEDAALLSLQMVSLHQMSKEGDIFPYESVFDILVEDWS